jgi:hypothetical protein
MSANMYRTKEGKYYHIHGSLEATTTLNMIGLPGHRPDLTDYNEIIKVPLPNSLLTLRQSEKLLASSQFPNSKN